MTDLPAFQWRPRRHVRDWRRYKRVTFDDQPHPVGSYRDGVLYLVELPLRSRTSDQGVTLLEWAKRMGPNGSTAAIVELLNSTNDILNDVVWMPVRRP